MALRQASPRAATPGLAAAAGVGLACLSLSRSESDFSPLSASHMPISESSEGGFLSSAGHDLRQPIQAVGLFVATLAAQSLPDATRKQVVMLEQAAQALSELFEAVILHSKVMSSHEAMGLQVVSAKDVLSRAVATHLDCAHEKDLHLRFVASSAQVMADPVLLERSLSVMVVHALRATNSGGVVLGCRRRVGVVCFEVWDSSAGLEEGVRASALAAFSPAWASLSDRGLGLATAAMWSKQMGGELTVDSRLGKGTVLRLSLRAA